MLGCGLCRGPCRRLLRQLPPCGSELPVDPLQLGAPRGKAGGALCKAALHISEFRAEGFTVLLPGLRISGRVIAFIILHCGCQSLQGSHLLLGSPEPLHLPPGLLTLLLSPPQLLPQLLSNSLRLPLDLLALPRLGLQLPLQLFNLLPHRVQCSLHEAHVCCPRETGDCLTAPSSSLPVGLDDFLSQGTVRAALHGQWPGRCSLSLHRRGAPFLWPVLRGRQDCASALGPVQPRPTARIIDLLLQHGKLLCHPVDFLGLLVALRLELLNFAPQAVTLRLYG
mmetsp:Transcript_21205/g.58890  ORF Transcript_21205/g.58890 Transcript_21205/m.58890 type:complete len:281 (-) Transcript_21205:203-1045(-)